MKLKLSRDWFDICILFISALGIYAGLSDLDYVWQADLGRQILQDGNFSGYYNQIWGSLGVAEYYDHEWLCNVLFYLFSFIPYKPLVWLKFFICLMSGCSFLYFLHKFGLMFISNFKKYQILIIWVLYCLVFLKIKAYSFSVVFFMIELVLLNKYKKEASNKLLVYLGILCILWTNIHSGSIPLFFICAFIYWLTYFKSRKLVGVGFLMLLSTCINPYGYKLILFNLKHNFDSTMKNIVLDWNSIDAKTEIGFLCTILILYSIILFVSSIKKDKAIFILSLIILYMSFGSLRHIIYYFPLLALQVKDSRIDFKVHFINNKYLVGFFIGLWFLVCFSTFSGDYGSYSHNYVSDELESIIYEIKSEEGLYNNHDFIDMTRYNKKNFITGAYPLHSQRVIDSYMLLNCLSSSQIEDVINYYKLDKFIFNKYNLNNHSKTGYLITNTLYNYLTENDEYEVVYDSRELVYIRKKGTK